MTEGMPYVAEREGFEPSVGYKPTHDFQSCALDQLSHLSKGMRFLPDLPSGMPDSDLL